MKFLSGSNDGSPVVKLFFGLLGLCIVLLVWILITSGENPVFNQFVLPSPFRVLASFSELLNENELIPNIGFSLGLNISGYLEAILIAIPVGFIIGLLKYPRWSFKWQIDAIRYIPLTAVTILFIVWFGIGAPMKIHFLAFGILIYLLPVMVQRIDEVNDVYLKTVHTLGATNWQVLKTVYIPSVLSRLFDDIRVLTAISWTYIIVAEMIASQGGIGNLIWLVGQRHGRMDKVFALLIIIMIIGIIQDKVFIWLDRQFFPHKYQASDAIKSSRIQERGILSVALDYAIVVLGWMGIGIYVILLINEFVPFLGDTKPLSYLFKSTVWVIHLLVISFLIFRGMKWLQQRADNAALRSVNAETSKR